MPIKILIKGNQDSNEYQDAQELKKVFMRDIPSDINGEILIISNVTLFGQGIKDIDLIVLGNFENYNLYLNSKAINSQKKELNLEKRNIFIRNFCFVIETKHQRAEDIQLEGLTLCVRYNNRLRDVTTQSEKQKYALFNYFFERGKIIKTQPYICNFIWLRNVTQESIKRLVDYKDSKIRETHNYLPQTFNIKWLFQLACLQDFPFSQIDEYSKKEKGYSLFRSIKSQNEKMNLHEMESIFQLFETIKKAHGELTRKKIEIITRNLINNQQYAQAIGEKLVIINGIQERVKL